MAYSSMAALLSSIKQDIGIDASKIARGVAQIAYDDLQIAHSSIMDCYYGEYSPVSSYYFFYEKDGRLFQGQSHGYRRKDNLRNNSIQPQGVFPSGEHGFSAIVQIGSSGMSNYVNSSGREFPASGVFDLVWNEGIRGLPSGYVGHIGEVDINAAPVGVAISGTPNNAMDEFVDTWGYQRGPQVADMVAFSI